MTHAGQYVLSLLCAGILCGIAPVFLQDSGTKNIAKMLGGLFLAITLLSPLPGLNVEEIIGNLLPDTVPAERLTQEGQAMSTEAMAQFIMTETQAYILDKAAVIGADIDIRIELSQDEIPIPAAATIDGQVTQAQRNYLQKLLKEDLGITEEAQRWISEP